MDEVRGLLAGTKDSVDHLVPRSEELLTQTQRQERAISNIHFDLTHKTNRIIEELSEVVLLLKKSISQTQMPIFRALGTLCSISGGLNKRDKNRA